MNRILNDEAYIEVTKNMLNGITTMPFQQQIISVSNAQILCLEMK